MASLSNNQQNIHDHSRHWEETFCNANNLTVFAFWKMALEETYSRNAFYHKPQGNYMKNSKTFRLVLFIIATSRPKHYGGTTNSSQKVPWIIVANDQKQLSRGVHRKRRYENLQQIYSRTHAKMWFQ